MTISFIKFCVTTIVILGLTYVHKSELLGSWPGHVTFLMSVLIFMVWFSEPIRSFIERIKSLSYKDTRMDLFASVEQASLKPNSLGVEQFDTQSINSKTPHDKENSVTPSKDPIQKFSKEDAYYELLDHEVAEKERNIRAYLDKKVSIDSSFSSKELPDFMIRNLAESYVTQNFLWVKCMIFPEQLEWLKAINNGGLSKFSAKSQYYIFLQRMQLTEMQYSLDKWVGWLINLRFVETDKGKLYTITDFGTRFLIFLTTNRLG